MLAATDEFILLLQDILLVSGHIPYDLLQHIMQRHKAGQRPVLIDDDRLMHPARAEELQELRQDERLRDEKRLMNRIHDRCLQRLARMLVLIDQDLRHIRKTLEVIQRALADRQTEMGCLHHIRPDLLLFILQIQPVKLRTRRHAIRRRTVIQLKNIINDLRLFLIEGTETRALLKKDLDLLLRHRLLAAHLHTEEAHHDLRRPCGEPHQRPTYRRHDDHRTRDDTRRLLRHRDGDPLRYQLADDEREISDEHHHRHHADLSRIRSEQGDPLHFTRQRPRQRRS